MAYPNNITILQTDDFSKESNPLPIYGYLETKTNLVYFYNFNIKNWVSTGGASGNPAWGGIAGDITTQTDLGVALGTKQSTNQKGQANGYAGLDVSGKVPSTQLPSYVDDVLEFADLASLPVTGETGKIYITLNTNKTYRWSGSAYFEISPSEVNSVAGKTGVVTLVKADVGLGNVDNTTDLNKPISTATQTALDLKQNTITNSDSITQGTTNLFLTTGERTKLSNTSGTNTGDQTTITGNAGSATVLQTARAINGVSFNGSADITVADSTKLAKAGDTITGNISNSATGFFQIPSGTTAQRPGTPLDGMRRYNTTTLRDEFYANGAWQSHARLSGDTFTGNLIAPQSGTLKQTLAPTGTTQTIDFNNGSLIDLSLTTATGNITLTLNNPVIAGCYLFFVTQGATARNVIFPAGTIQQGGTGQTYSGFANTKDLISALWDGSKYIISINRNIN